MGWYGMAVGRKQQQHRYPGDGGSAGCVLAGSAAMGRQGVLRPCQRAWPSVDVCVMGLSCDVNGAVSMTTTRSLLLLMAVAL